jgi:uncharacterized membrane protein
MLLASIWMIVRELAANPRPWWIFPVILGLLLFNPLLIHILQGQINILILMLLTAGWMLDRRGPEGWAGVLVGLAAAIKLAPAFLFTYFLFTRRWRAWQAVPLSSCSRMPQRSRCLERRHFALTSTKPCRARPRA